MRSTELALLLPGQGAHCPNMLDGFLGNQAFNRDYKIICDVLGYSPLETIAKDPALVNTNLLSSLFTCLASRLSYLRFQEVEKKTPAFLSGYSVGQLTALHIAGCFDFAELVQVVAKRACLMDECAKTVRGSMLAIIGVGEEPVRNLCRDLAAQGHQIWISNYNCFGQYTLAGTQEALRLAMDAASQLKPKRLLEVPVAGAWHCPLLSDAVPQFEAYLKTRSWQSPEIPVIDNVTGRFLPTDTEALKQQLLSHLISPVRWDTGIKLLVAEGCTRFVEIGYGNVLTKFGFFIDRAVTFEAFCGDEKAVCAE